MKQIKHISLRSVEKCTRKTPHIEDSLYEADCDDALVNFAMVQYISKKEKIT